MFYLKRQDILMPIYNKILIAGTNYYNLCTLTNFTQLSLILICILLLLTTFVNKC